jgi:hypothetical protein
MKEVDNGKVSVSALTKAVSWSESDKPSSTTLDNNDIGLIVRLGDRFGTAGVNKFLETFTAIEEDFPPAVRKSICDAADAFTDPQLHWTIANSDRNVSPVSEHEAVEQWTDQDDFLPSTNKLSQ